MNDTNTEHIKLYRSVLRSIDENDKSKRRSGYRLGGEMRIGLVVAGFPPDRIGGAELQCRQLAVQLVKAGHEVVVFTRRFSAERPSRELQNGYEIRRRAIIPIPGLRLVWDTIFAVIQVIRCRPCVDVLLAYQTINSGFVAVLAKRLSGVPAVISIRGNEEYIIGSSFLKRAAVSAAYRGASAIAVQTPLIERELLVSFKPWVDEPFMEMLRAKIKVVPNGIAVPTNPSKAGDYVLYVGRLIENKGVADLLDAVRGQARVRTVVVGDGPDRVRLEGIAKGSDVEFVGMVEPEEVAFYLKDALVLVLPSRLGDGLPNVILEAMAHGVPVIATRSAGIPDIVSDGQTGLLIDPGDVDALRSAIERLVADSGLHSAISQNTLQFIKQFAWSTVVPQVVAMLQFARTRGKAGPALR